MMKRNRFRWWALVGSDNLNIFKLIFLRPNNEFSHSSTPDILNFLES
jgi:hypothetical protein